jgi:CubicO group peptidase (beta-lactamase class C family)
MLAASACALLALCGAAFASSDRHGQISSSSSSSNKKYDWSGAESVVAAAIKNGAMPGASWAFLGPEGNVIGMGSAGHFTYGLPPPLNGGSVPKTEFDTLYDMASCTKVVAATSTVALLYQRGFLPLDTRIDSLLGPKYAQEGKGPITILNCLLHNAGYPPDPTPFWYWYKQFDCPQTKDFHPPEDFSCRQKILESLFTQKLVNPIGAKYVYSDLSFITLMWAAGAVVRDNNLVKPEALLPDCVKAHTSLNGTVEESVIQCYYEAFVRTEVFEPLKMVQTGYLPPERVWPTAAPCENDTIYKHGTWQGQVSDRNAFSMGGISGHAGLFSRVPDLIPFMQRYMHPASYHDHKFLNETTVKLFIKEYNHSQSSRALGWNTNDPTVFDYGWDLLCGNMSAKTYTHVGFTGTQLCGDPERNLTTIFLTNRVYPSAKNFKIEDVRRAFNKQVVAAFDKVHGTPDFTTREPQAEHEDTAHTR